HEGLLGILGGDAPETSGCDLDLDFLADLRVGLDAAGIENGNLIVLGEHALRNHQPGKGLDVAGLWVNRATQLAGRADSLLRRRQQSLIDSRHEDISTDALFS